MKKSVLVLVAIFLTINVFSQDEKTVKDTLVKKYQKDEMRTIAGGTHAAGGYLDFSVRYCDFQGRPGFESGGKLGFIMNHAFTLGVGGYFFGNETKFDPILGDDYGLRGGYGGLFMEQIIFPKSAVHLTIPVFFGVGGAAYMNDNQYNSYGNHWDNENINTNVADGCAFVIVKPGIELELNMMQYFRIDLGVYYNYTSNFDLTDEATGKSLTQKKPIDGLSAGLTLKFGFF